MSTGKIFCMIFALMIVLSSPQPLRAEPQKEQVPAQELAYDRRSFLAGILTAINIPSRLVLCGMDAGLGFIVMGASAGRRYTQASEIIEEGCAGPWVIDRQMLTEEAQRKETVSGKVSSQYGWR